MEEFFNISKWKSHKINYWGIPKCANTSVKHALIGSKNTKEFILLKHKKNLEYTAYSLLKDSYKWVHDPLLCHYINKDIAINNGLTNITLIRNPIERFKSQFKYNIKFRLVNAKSVDCLLAHIEQTSEETRNIHFKSQCYFITDNQLHVLTDYIFKTEKIYDLERFLSLKIPRINNIDDEVYLSSKQMSQIQRIYERDFNIYETY